jgi:2-oxoglutarate ferredoxin oxidoreductase subunit delta
MSSSGEFEIVILDHLCKGCGLCVAFCEQGKLYIRQKPNRRGVQTVAVRAETDCTGCLRCATICPDGAVQVTRMGVRAESARDGSGQSRNAGVEEPAGK